MATMLRSTAGTWGNVGFTTLLVRRLSHVMALPPPLDAPIHRELTSPPLVLPESDGSDDGNNIGFGFEFPSFSFGGSMELMAVPKRKELWSGQAATLLLLQRKEGRCRRAKRFIQIIKFSDTNYQTLVDY
ncbi:hypothetical protein CFP56_017495 [Quercus suber]|uniref:Uncharacterized protein n=1 Tax=Quercus suber TaxID=58331 RepID=A0AAW0KN32_QUESU